MTSEEIAAEYARMDAILRDIQDRWRRIADTYGVLDTGTEPCHDTGTGESLPATEKGGQ